MKITVVTNMYWPDEAGAAAIITDLCEGLSERGFEVTVLTTFPYYPEWKRKCDTPRFRVHESRRNKVRILRHWMYVPGNPSSLWGRLLYESSFFVSLLRSLFLVRQADKMIAFSSMGGQLAFAVLARQLFGRPLWIYVQDILGDALTVTKIGSPLAGNIFGVIQQIIYRRADLLTAISPEMTDRVRELARPGQRVELVPNWLHSNFQKMIDGEAELETPRKGRPWKLLYAGNVGKKQGLNELCVWLQKSDLKFSLEVCGSGSEADRTRNSLDRMEDQRFKFGPILPPQDYIKALKNADFFLIPQRPGVGNSFIPSKLITCIACGTPILAICDHDSPLGNEVCNHNLGIVCSWNELDRLGEVLSRMNENRDEYVRACAIRSQDYGHKNGVGRCSSILQTI